MQTAVNATYMVLYNMRDCVANLDLCKKLDLVNEIVSLCFVAKAWATGGMVWDTLSDPSTFWFRA